MSKLHAKHAAAALASAVAVLTACGHNTAGQAPSIDVATRAQLRQDVHAVATALAAHRLPSAETALESLNADTAAAHTAGKLSDATFAKIRAAAKALGTDLEHLANRPAPTMTVTETAPPPNDHGHPGGGKGHQGKGKGDEGKGKDHQGGGKGPEGGGGKPG